MISREVEQVPSCVYRTSCDKARALNNLAAVAMNTIVQHFDSPRIMLLLSQFAHQIKS